jgi:hypothetical protein
MEMRDLVRGSRQAVRRIRESVLNQTQTILYTAILLLLALPWVRLDPLVLTAVA